VHWLSRLPGRLKIKICIRVHIETVHGEDVFCCRAQQVFSYNNITGPHERPSIIIKIGRMDGYYILTAGDAERIMSHRLFKVAAI
jgi:hypothetical protein